MRAGRAAEPTKSENITVTWRRLARSSGWALGEFDAVATSAEGALPLASVRSAAIASRSLRRCPHGGGVEILRLWVKRVSCSVALRAHELKTCATGNHHRRGKSPLRAIPAL